MQELALEGFGVHHLILGFSGHSSAAAQVTEFGAAASQHARLADCEAISDRSALRVQAEGPQHATVN